MKYSILLFITLGLISCHSDEVDSAMIEVTAYPYEDMDIEEESLGEVYDLSLSIPRTAEPPVYQTSSKYVNAKDKESAELQSPMIIHHGEMSIEVQDLSSAKNSIDSLLSKYSSYYQKEDYNTGYSSSNYRLIIRIPSKSFNDVVSILEGGIGEVKSKEIGADDITEEYVDLQLRLENNMEYLKRYLKLLDRADSIKDMIVIQEKVRRLEEEIESKKGRVRYLKNKVSFSTVQLTIIHEHPAVASADDDHFGKEIASAFVSGYNGALSFILIIVSVWPFLLFLIIIVWCVKKLLRGRKKKVVLSDI